MGLILALVMTFGMLWALKALSEAVFPPAGRLFDAATRSFVDLFWKRPVRQAGAGMMFLGVFLFVTVVSTLGALADGGAVPWVGTLFLWAIVYGLWRFLRWRAARRFGPRPLPRRERRDER